MTVQRLSSRRRLQSLRPSETFQRLVRHETSICRVLQIPSRPRCHGVTLVRKLRFTALYWPSNGGSLQKGRPKASADDHPSTQKVKNCSIFKIIFFSLVCCATSLRRREPPCLVHHVHTLPLAIAIAMDDQDPAQPVRVHRRAAVLLQLHDRDFLSSSFAKERLSNSFAFDSFVRNQASMGESKKKKERKEKNAG